MPRVRKSFQESGTLTPTSTTIEKVSSRRFPIGKLIRTRVFRHTQCVRVSSHTGVCSKVCAHVSGFDLVQNKPQNKSNKPENVCEKIKTQPEKIPITGKTLPEENLPGKRVRKISNSPEKK